MTTNVIAGQTRTYWLHAITPLHVGTGEGLGFIDLPIMREKVTNWPIVPGSAVKGVYRDFINTNGSAAQKALIVAAFGRADEAGEPANAGSMVFSDARIILLPVRSLFGTFAWITSPLVLKRFARDIDMTGSTMPPVSDLEIPKECILVHDVMASDIHGDGEKVYFEDLDFGLDKDTNRLHNAKLWGLYFSQQLFPENPTWQKIFCKRFAIVPCSTFDFLCETATEVSARIRIEQDSKTVREGALWYEESLPVETIMAGLVWCDFVFGGNGKTPEDILNTFCINPARPLQIGGKATVGKGRVRTLFGSGR